MRKLTGLKSQQSSLNPSRGPLESRYSMTDKTNTTKRNRRKRINYVEPIKLYVHEKNLFNVDFEPILLYYTKILREQQLHNFV